MQGESASQPTLSLNQPLLTAGQCPALWESFFLARDLVFTTTARRSPRRQHLPVQTKAVCGKSSVCDHGVYTWENRVSGLRQPLNPPRTGLRPPDTGGCCQMLSLPFLGDMQCSLCSFQWRQAGEKAVATRCQSAA